MSVESDTDLSNCHGERAVTKGVFWMHNAWRRLIQGPGLFMAVAVLVIGILTVQGLSIYRSYNATWALATRSAENVLQSLTANIERNLNVIDLSVAGLQDAAAIEGIDGLSPAVRHALLFDRAGTARYLGSLLALDAKGNIRFDSRSDKARSGNFADRDYFLMQVAPYEGTYLSNPFVGRLGNKEMSIALSRRISGEKGEFLGIAVAALRTSFFESLFDEVKLGPDSSIRLVNMDGIIIATHPDVEGVDDVGVDMSASPLFRQMNVTPRVPFFFTSADGIERLYLTRKIAEFPLLLAVGLSTTEVLREWQSQAFVALVLTLAACSFIVLLFAALRTALRESQKMEAHMQSMAQTDSLTGMPNRRALDVAIASEMRRSRRHNTPLSILMIDIDHFKDVNDSYGHSVGDEVLHRMGQFIMDKCRRAGDLAARYGGEEFTVLLPGTKPDEATMFAQTLRTGIMEMVPSLASPSLKQVTVSIGVASNSADTAMTPDDLLKRADLALYVAKEAGRNRVSFETGAL